MSKNTLTTIETETKEPQHIFIFLVLFILSLLTIIFLLTKNLLILVTYFLLFNFVEIYYLQQKINKKDLVYSLIKFFMQVVIYVFMFKFFSKNETTNNSIITFYTLMILPLYFTSFVYYNLRDKKVPVQDKVYKSIKDIYSFKKESLKLILLFGILFGTIKLGALTIEASNLKLVNKISLISYIIIMTMTLYMLLSSSRKIKIYKGEYDYDAKS